MLSRIAESLFWIGRYLERAEYTCRIVEVHLQLLLDDPSVDQDAAGQSLLEVMGCPPPEGSTADAQYVLTALCYDAASPASVAAALGGARESARRARETVSTEMWEAINTTWNSVRGGRLQRMRPATAFKLIRERCAVISGTADSTMSHDEGWRFLVLGRSIERADMTARLIQSASITSGSQSAWNNVLRGCGALAKPAKARLLKVGAQTIAALLGVDDATAAARLDAALRPTPTTPTGTDAPRAASPDASGGSVAPSATAGAQAIGPRVVLDTDASHVQVAGTWRESEAGWAAHLAEMTARRRVEAVRYDVQQCPGNTVRVARDTRQAGAGGQFPVEEEQVAHAERPDRCKYPVPERDPVAWRALQCRVGEKGEKHGQCEVDRARLGVVEDEHAERERQRRGDPELHQGPCQRDQHDEPRRPSGRLAPTRVGLGDDLAELFVGELETVFLFFRAGHGLPRRESPHSTDDGKKTARASGPPPFS